MGTNHFLNPENIINEMGITEGMKIADFGSGSGHFTVIMAQKVGEDGRVAAIDVQPNTLEALREKSKANGLENIDFIHADLEVLEGTGIPDGSIDLVLISDTLFQSNKKPEMLKEAKRILKADGKVIIIDWKKGTGGFGPPDDLRTEEEVMKSLTSEEGFVFERNINAGQFHFGFIARNS